DLRARVTVWSRSRRPTGLYRKPAAPALNASASFAELPPPVITSTGAVTPRSRRRASKLKPRLLSESQRPAGRGRDDYVEQDEIERLSSQDLERLRRGLGGGDLI